VRLRNLFLATALATGALATTASAAGVTPHSFSKGYQSGPHSISQGGNWEIVDTDGDTVTLDFRCAINGGTGAAAVGLNECYLAGEDGVTFYRPGMLFSVTGPTWAEGGVGTNAPRQRYRLCVRSSVLFRDGTSAGLPLDCSPLQ